MINQNTNDMKAKAAVGTGTVYLILIVSLAATLAYWYVLAGLETATGLSDMWMMLLWISVGVGAVAELIKKVTLSTFRNKNIWLAATFVSVLTVLGTYSILNQTRQNDLTKQSDSYKDSRASKQSADFIAAKYAYTAGYDLSKLESQLDQVIVDRDNRKIKYNTYLKRKQGIEKKISDKRAYDSATGTAQTAQTNMSMGGGISDSSNPLLASIASVFALSENLLTMAFYLFVTILLEVAAFWIGGKVEEIKLHMKLTEAELLDMKNQELFGFSVRDVQRELFDRVRRSQLDAIDAEYEVQQIRRTRKDVDSGRKLSAGEVAENVNDARTHADANKVQAKQPQTVPSSENSRAEKIGFNLSKVESSADVNRAKNQAQNKATQAPDTSLIQGKAYSDLNTSLDTSKSNDNHSVTPVLKKAPCASTENAFKTSSIQEPDTSNQTSFSDTDLMYPEWKRAVLNNECKLTARQCRLWVKKHLGMNNSKQVKNVTDKYSSTIVDLLYIRGLNEGIIQINPKWKDGSRLQKHIKQ